MTGTIASAGLTRRALLLAAAAKAGAELPPQPLKAPAGVEDVRIASSFDGRPQPAWFLPGAGAGARPLLVHLHSWSAHYNQSGGVEEAVELCRARGWGFVSPEFRGPNERPEACASRFAVRDVLDAVNYARRRGPVDAERIYVAGGSGGGHMALVMAHQAPRLWAAVSAWVPISDLAAWHAFSLKQKSRYWKMMEACCGGPPGPETAAEYRARSPLFFLARAAGLAVDIQAGIRDGHEGSVPVSHSLRAFNMLAEANGEPGRRLAEADIEFITGEAALPEALKGQAPEESGRRRRVLFRRTGGPARLTLFDGAHETDFPAAVAWLEGKSRRGSPTRASSVRVRTKQA